MIIKPCAQRGWKVGYWASTPMSAGNSFGQNMAFSVPINITSTALSRPGSKRLRWRSKVFHPQRDPGADPKGNRKPRTSQKRFLKQSKERQNRNGAGGRGSPCGNPGTLSRAEAAPHAHPPSSRGTSVRPHRGCLWTQQAKVMPHARVPEPPSPPPQSQLAASGAGKEYFSKNHFPPERFMTRW